MSTTTMKLIENADGTLILQREGEPDVPDARLRRAFPWSKAGEFISVRDEKGKERAIIRSLSDLDADQRRIVERYLAENSCIPMVKRIESVNTDFGYQEWTVETDRGRANFRVQEREDIRFLPDGRFSIKDVEGNIYALPPLAQLDAHSQRAVESVL